jgi:hypothetical protein
MDPVPGLRLSHTKKEALYFLDWIKLEMEQDENQFVFKPFECACPASASFASARNASLLFAVEQIVFVCLLKGWQEFIKGQHSQSCKTLKYRRVLFQYYETDHDQLPEFEFGLSYNISLFPVNSNISMQDMVLLNSKNGNAVPNHYDPSLGQNINVSRDYISGYVAFPMSVLDENENCIPMLDASSNTTITLRADGIKISTYSGNVSNHQLTWFLRYHSLLDLQITPTPVANNLYATPECCHIPPTPDITKLPSDEIYWNDYWEGMARYVWAYVVNP